MAELKDDVFYLDKPGLLVPGRALKSALIGMEALLEEVDRMAKSSSKRERKDAAETAHRTASMVRRSVLMALPDRPEVEDKSVKTKDVCGFCGKSVTDCTWDHSEWRQS